MPENIKVENFSNSETFKISKTDCNYMMFDSDTSEQFWPILLILRVFGRCPIVQERSSKNITNYTIKIKSFTFIYTVIIGSLISSSWIFYFLNISVGLDWRGRMIRSTFGSESAHVQNLSEQSEHFYQDPGKPIGTTVKITGFIAAVTIPVVVLLEIFTDWFTTSTLIIWLNNWSSIQSEFNHTFLHTSKFVSTIRSSQRRIVILFALVPSVIFIAATFSNKSLYAINGNIALRVVFGFIFYTSVTFMTIVEDIKVILMYKSLAEAFQQVNRAITLQYKRPSPWTTCKSKEVKAWAHIINLIRKQVKLAGKYQTPQQFSSVILVSIQLSLTLFFSLFIVTQKATLMWPGFIAASIFCFISCTRLFVKAIWADRVTEKEQLIAENLLEIYESEYDPSTLTELKFLFNIIKNHPSVISLGNIFVFNKRLMVSIGTQVVTFLIIIVQFNNST